MKKILALVLAAMMLLGMCSFAAAEELPEGYPAIIEGLDFGGATIYIHDWWSNDDEAHSARSAEPDEETQLLYDYRDWLEATYNCKIVEVALSDWSGNPTELANMVMNKIAIGKILKLSPSFPPLHTVRASFPAHGVPSLCNHR